AARPPQSFTKRWFSKRAAGGLLWRVTERQAKASDPAVLLAYRAPGISGANISSARKQGGFSAPFWSP
ncbi:MAG: hypothetical protein FWB74_10280, partial [Defluviitaleaceae bacterium]|nr:hypothetical protein [Defluviitaleaceae bacterium]